MPYLSATLRPQGELLSNYSLLGEAGASQPDRRDQRPAAERRDHRGLLHLRRVPAGRESERKRSRQRRWLRLPGRNADPRRPAGQQPLHLARLRRRHGRHDGQPGELRPSRPRRSRNGRCPAATRRRQNPFVYFHSLLDLGDCSANDLPIDQLTADLRKAEKTPNFSFIAPTLCNPARPASARRGGPKGRRAPTPSSRPGCRRSSHRRPTRPTAC